MNKELLKKFLNHSISKSDGKINISVLDMQSESLQDEEETEKRLNETFETLDKMLLQDGHKKIIESQIIIISIQEKTIVANYLFCKTKIHVLL